MLDGLVVPIFQVIYNLLHAIAGIFWWIDQAIIAVGYYIMALTDWLVDVAMSPLIDAISNQTGGLLVPIFAIAMLVLAITYLLAVFGQIQIVTFHSAVLWLLFAGFIYQLGPELYQGTEHLRRGIGGLFYEEGINALSSGSTDMTALSLVGTSSEAQMATPANQFAPWIASDVTIDGLDVAMAYLYADGCDVLRASGCLVVGPLPYRWYIPTQEPNYFNNDVSGLFFPVMLNDVRQLSLEAAAMGVWRLASGGIVAFFGLIEQLVHLTLAIAMGVAYISMLVGVLFAFFKRTEPIALSIFNLVLEIFIQSIITSLLLSIVISFVIIGASTGNAVVLFGTCFVGLVLAVVLLLGALKALQNATNRLMGAMTQATGGNLGAAGQVTRIATSAMGGGIALAGGATPIQATGVALANTQAAQGAYFAVSAFGRDSAIGNMASQIFEGASLGRVFGPLPAGMLISQSSSTRPSDRTADAPPLDEDGLPMPVYDRQQALGTPITQPQWDDSAIDAFERLYTIIEQNPALRDSISASSHPSSTATPAHYTNTTRPNSNRSDNMVNPIEQSEQISSHPTSITRMDDLVAKVDASDDDDFARLSQTIVTNSPGNDPLKQLRDTASSADMATFDRLTDGLRLPPTQVSQLAQLAVDGNPIGIQLATAIRSHLATLPAQSGGHLQANTIHRAMTALEKSIDRLAQTADSTNSDSTLDQQVTAGKPTLTRETPS